MDKKEIQISLDRLRRELFEEMKKYNIAVELNASEEVQSEIRMKMLSIQQQIRELTLREGYRNRE